MPFTPYHFGPGLGKSIAPRWYSMGTFMAVQVVIDVETLYHIVQRDVVLHDVLHTFIGATAVGLVAAAIIVWAIGLVRRFDTGAQLLAWAERVGLGGEVRPTSRCGLHVVAGMTTLAACSMPTLTLHTSRISTVCGSARVDPEFMRVLNDEPSESLTHALPRTVLMR